MNRTHSLVVVFLLVFSAAVAAQSSQTSKPEPVKPLAANTTPAKESEVERHSMHQHSMPEFNFPGVFQSLANEDYDRAVALARVFEHEALRANAVMAIALAVLNENRR